jgi:hypothetical protein
MMDRAKVTSQGTMRMMDMLLEKGCILLLTLMVEDPHLIKSLLPSKKRNRKLKPSDSDYSKI